MHKEPSCIFLCVHPYTEWNGDHTDEYCDTEVLRAECADGEVLVMEKAHYGRMKIGRCVEIPMGNVGCFTDVLRLADRRCSGRRVCELRVPDAEFEASHPCLRELKTYLEASYTCIKGDGLVIFNRRCGQVSDLCHLLSIFMLYHKIHPILHT